MSKLMSKLISKLTSKLTRNIVIAIVLIIGVLIGRWTNNKVKVEYVKGETVRDTIYSEKLVPYNVYIPPKPSLPLKPDTINNVVYLSVDTAQIIANYIKKNSYRKVMFDDLNGKLIVDAVVQYNQLGRLAYEFTPIQKQTTITKKRTLVPFLSSSWNSFGVVGIGGGLYYNDVGLGAKYITDFSHTGYEIGLNIKF
jgi:hypothetical protein